MYNELKLNITGKVSMELSLEEKHALLVELEERVGALLEAYGVSGLKYRNSISQIVYIDDDYEC